MTAREHILAALPQPRNRATSEPPFGARRESFDEMALWAMFQEQLELLGGKLVAREEALVAMREPLFRDEDVPDWVPSASASIWEASVGVTTADLAIAETGSLLLSGGEGRARLASLAPPIHIVAMSRRSIVRTLEEAFFQLPQSTSVLITGTSRTADIEGVLVRGVHGPRDLWVVVE